SPNIIYTGASPNQQVLPAVEWAYENLGTNFFLVGSDYVFPRSANEIIKFKIQELGGTVAGEEYALLGDTNFEGIVDKISESKPDVILNTINGDSNIAFFKELRNKGITSQQIPTISFSIAEDEIRNFGAEYLTGDYASWNYFQSLSSEKNKIFVENFKKKYGSDRVVDDPMEAGYLGVYLYAKAVESVGTDDVSAVRSALQGMTFNAPEGAVGIDPENQHLSKVVRIGEIRSDGQFKIVSSSEKPIKPEPFPKYKSEKQWNDFLNELYIGWNGNWANPTLVSQGVEK
ncbi:MAG: transporter substrate-binding protein, partial [Nitrosopumilus sp.]|nr:transporter substrate-binding protein [Nitrosopumilus sp.]